MLGTDVDTQRLEVAEELGADYTVNVQKSDAAQVLHKLGDGFGADVVVDCTGVSAALRQAMDLVRPLGTIVKIGWGPQPLNFSLDPLVAKAATLQGSFSHTYATWERVLQPDGDRPAQPRPHDRRRLPARRLGGGFPRHGDRARM